MDEIEDQKEEQEERGFSMKGLAKALAILYVLAVYFVIFLKIVFLE